MPEPPINLRDLAELALADMNVSFETVLEAVGLAITALCDVGEAAQARGELELSVQAMDAAEATLAKLRPLIKP